MAIGQTEARDSSLLIVLDRAWTGAKSKSFIFNPVFDQLINDLDEVIEMLIAMAAAIFMVLKSRQWSGLA